MSERIRRKERIEGRNGRIEGMERNYRVARKGRIEGMERIESEEMREGLEGMGKNFTSSEVYEWEGVEGMRKNRVEECGG